jgi:hypothetical protein
MKLNVKLNNNTLDQYDKALSTYNEWKSFYRDIKLSTLLEGKKVQFDIDNIQKIGMVHDFVTLENPGKLQTMAFSISGMTFIIKDNDIEKLTLEAEFLETDCGKKLKEIYDAGIELEVRQVFTERNISFTIDLPETKNPFN